MVSDPSVAPAGSSPAGLRTRIAWFALPMLFCLWLNWLGLKTWFTADDFAWLGLRPRVHDFSTLGWALFHPFAQGTVRTLSERAYFLVFSSLFGLNVIPFRIAAFLTQFAAIGFLMAVLRRLSGSALAAFLAPLLWCCAAPMAMALGGRWGYNANS